MFNPVQSNEQWGSKYSGAGFQDTEIMIKARRMGLKCLEIPVYWIEKKYKKVEYNRLIKEIRFATTKILYLLFKDKIIRQQRVAEPKGLNDLE